MKRFFGWMCLAFLITLALWLGGCHVTVEHGPGRYEFAAGKPADIQAGRSRSPVSAVEITLDDVRP